MRVFILDRVLQEKGMGYVDLSKESGVGRSTIDDIRRNNGSGRRRPTIEKLAAALNMTYDDLFEETPDIAPAVRKPIGINNAELADIAEQYEEDGNLAMYQRLSGIASQIGNSVEVLLDKGDELYNDGEEDGAKGAYAQAILSLRPRHLPRLKQSLRNYLDICEKERNVPPIISLYRMAKERKLGDLELFYQIGTFFARTKQPDKLVNECFDIVQEFIDMED